LGKICKIPDQFLNRHPFPGPGLAIRVLGEVTKDRVEILKKVDEVFISELINHNIYNKVAQALAALLPVKAVGVMGDSRTYSYIIALRSVDTEDFMTADWSKIPNDILEKVSSRIVNEVNGVNRVVYDITQKPPATIEYE
jgi:GMP synthase (glutamine-hydrolysing)